jgi:hypothetical protein
VQIQVLELFVESNKICDRMAEVQGFSNFIVSRLSDTESTTSPLTWRFFTKFAAYSSVFHRILRSPAGKTLAQLAASKYTPVLKRFLEFSIDVMRNQKPESIKEFHELLTPSLGKLACIFRARRSLFHGDDRMLQLMDDYARAILHLGTNIAEELTGAFMKHINAHVDPPTEGKGSGSRSQRGRQRSASQVFRREILT